MQTRASRNVDDLSVLARSTETEPHSAHRMDEGVASPAIHLASQAADVHVDDVRHGVKMQIPHVLQQQRARHDLAGVTNEICKQLELFRQQVDLAALSAHAASKQVH